MSGSATNFAGTLTGGIQDISALLPIIGTDQCEQHVGSALEGGFLYAVATPLSLFGSLGIVKAGISVLVASISIPKPSLSFPLRLSFEKKRFWHWVSIPIPSLKFTPLPELSFVSSRSLYIRFRYFKPSLKLKSLLSITSSRRLWCGARVLDNAGFKLAGRVAPLIGMDGKRYKAESRLIEILEEKHIDTPENLSVDWRSTDWNISLVIGTIVAALISGTPYLYLLLKDPPESIHSPWVFPFLRTLGSCLTTVCCQFLIQSRVILLMKSRIVFMIMHRLLVDDLKKDNQDESILKEQEFRWDEDFPAEECLWSLEQYLLSRHPSAKHSCSFRQYMLLLKVCLQGLVHSLLSKVRIPVVQDIETHPRNSDVLEQWVNILRDRERSPASDSDVDDVEPFPHLSGVQPFFNPDHILHTLLKQHAEHFHTPWLHHIFIMVSWLLLLVSLPAAVAGYVGCFTLVRNSQSSGPLVWLGLEAALSALRILLWAWNPSFDEKTGIEVKLQLTKEQPLVTTQWDTDVLELEIHRANELPERQFLEHITPYTGPLEQFKKPDNTALYFAFTLNKECTLRCLFMTVLDLTNRAAYTLYSDFKGTIVYAHTEVTPDTNSGEMLASIEWDSAVSVDHARRINIPIHDLAKYYSSLLHSLTRSKGSIVASLLWSWSLVAKASENEIQHEERRKRRGHQDMISMRNNRERETSIQANLTEHDFLCLQQSHEHRLKTRLMEIWGKWIVDGVEAMYRDGCNDLALANPTSDEAKRELDAFNVLLIQEWTKRELAHLQLSAALENVLHSHVQQNAEKLAKEERKMTLSLEWSYDLQKQRLESERAKVKARGKTIVEKRSEQNEFACIWQAGQAFVEKKWTAAVESASFEEGSSEVTTEHEWFGESDEEIRALVEKLKPRFAWWNDQRSCERREMEATVERISKADAKQLVQAYKYQKSSAELAARIYSRYVSLPYDSDSEESAFVAKVSSATVYDVYSISSADVIRTVAENSSCRSLINVASRLIPHIPESDNLLFCSSYLREIDLPFIQRNRNRWWEQQNTNSWTLHLSPRWVNNDINDSQHVLSSYGTIVHIMVFLQTSTRLRLHLLHCRGGDVELSIQENDREIRHVRPAEISKDKLVWQDHDLDWVEPGQHELQLVVSQADHWYKLQDLTLEFVDYPSSDTVVSNLTYSN